MRASINHVTLSEDDRLHQQLQDFWNTESFGCAFKEHTARSVLDERALQTLEATTKNVGERYEIGMLWHYEKPSLPFNRALAEGRFAHLERKFARDPPLHQKYSEIIAKYIDKGYAKLLSPEESRIMTPKTWYLPHHPVLAPHKKLRVVFDAAAKYRGTSLNDQLVSGPDLLNSLVGVLLRFRANQVAIMADIEAMFHQVRVKKEDREALRFLWRDTAAPNQPLVTYQMQVHIFGATSSPCCATYALRRTAMDNASSYDDATIEAVLHTFNADDLLKSVRTSKAAIHLAHQLTDLLQKGGFRLNKWISNSRAVMAALPPSELATPSINLDLDDLPVERALGVYWNVERDEFTFNIALNCTNTKRGVLKAVSSIFDPLGFLAPFIFNAKHLLQELWRHKLEWDQEISGRELETWQAWKQDLLNLAAFRYSRCFEVRTLEEAQALELHVFADASEMGFAAVAYLRLSYPSGRIACSFLMAKSRLAPLRPLTTPRLELQAAVMAVRLGTTLLKELDLTTHEVSCWSDSTTLQYTFTTKPEDSTPLSPTKLQRGEQQTPLVAARPGDSQPC